MKQRNGSAAVEVRSLKKAYRLEGKPLEVLKDVSCTFYENESVSIVGASGVGKTTLLHIIGTLDRPTSGTILHFSQDVFSWPDKRLSCFRNEEIGFVFQFHHLLPEFNCLENVMMPCLLAGEGQRHAIDRARELLDYLGLGGKEELNVKKLSGGEQQRVALARALVRNPRLILADEPTGNLDERSGQKVARLLFKIREEVKATLIIVTHNLNLAGMTDRCIGLKSGRAYELAKERLAEFVMDEAA
ncbi:MAG: ABC transporter ATP-binding protein [Thermodesulfobacteria bacterium]|nr:ABC transporter ATP-binding protein [Thermodesulfobacteriota bacterium]